MGGESARVYGDDGWQTLPGLPVVRGPFEFAFDTPGLTEGVPFYTPTVGDLLLRVIWVCHESWDGTTPTLNFGTAVGTTDGLLSAPNAISSGHIVADNEDAGAGLLSGNTGDNYSDPFAYASGSGYRLQSLVVAPNPVKVWVTQDGLAGGADPGATQGRARLYWATVTPRAV